MTKEISDIEVDKIIEFIDANYSFNLSNYCRVLITRRLQYILVKHNLIIVDQLIAKLINNPSFIDIFIADLLIETTELFREPKVWIAISEKVIPLLISEFGYVNIWIADCASGEDYYSLMILLNDKFSYLPINILVTSPSEYSLCKIKNGEIHQKKLKLSDKNLKEFEPNKSFENYFRQEYRKNLFNSPQTISSTFKKLNLLTDILPDNINLLLYRNKFQIFNQHLQDLIISKLTKSLMQKCIIVPGIWENIANQNIEIFDKTENIYQVKNG